MIRFSGVHQPDQEQEEQAFLQNLLVAHIPARKTMTRPVALRSTSEQRHLALRSFLRRTWFDDTLDRLEKVLVLAVVGFFGFWLFNSYGYDWLYAQGFLARQYPLIAGTTATFPYPRSSGDYWRSEALITAPPPEHAQALPFTTPAMHDGAARPDYLSPQILVVPPEPSDRRPYRLTIPAIQVDTPVQEVFIEHGMWQVADYAAGYHHGSALPGDVGNVVMAGHAGLRGSVFRDLGNLRPSNDIFVESGGWRYRYQVRQVLHVWPTQVEITSPTPSPVLTLITCTDWDTKRLVVIADLVDSRPVQGM